MLSWYGTFLAYLALAGRQQQPAFTAALPLECQPLTSADSRFIPIFHPLPELRPLSAGPHAGLLWTDQGNDANGVFEHNGVYHIMFQTDCTALDALPGGICAGGNVGAHAFSHLVSADGARWKRLPDALIPLNTSTYDGADGDCDGTVSFPEGIGPVILWGADCGRGKWPPDTMDGTGIPSAALSRLPQTRDYPRVAVAKASNASDPLLEHWIKSADNPIAWADPSRPCSFPGRVWRSDAGGQRHWSMVCTGATSVPTPGFPYPKQGPWYRMATTDPSLHGEWKLADATFVRVGDQDPRPIGSIGSPSFYALPNPRKGEPTHIINAGNQGGLLRTAVFDPETETVTNVSTKTYPLGAGWSVAGQSERDGSILYFGPAPGVSYFAAHDSGVPSLTVYTLVRTISYDRGTKGLVANPLSSYSTLRNSTLVQRTGLRLVPGKLYTPQLPINSGTALDI
eukprot:SAG31_NODE_4317_length_3363_cov_1.982230_2_plen_454_part_01